MRKLLWVAMPFALMLACSQPAEETAAEPEAPADEYWAYFGTYTRETSKGIYKSRFNNATGELGEPELAAELENPSFLAFHPNGRYLYAVSETDDGSVAAFSIDKQTGNLMPINSQPVQGDAPCDLEVDSTGSMLVVANYTSGNTIAYKLNDDGSISEATSVHQHEGSGPHRRQQGPHAHSVDFSADNQYVFVSDLGIDKVLVYKADVSAGTLELVGEGEAVPASGPRHFAMHPAQPWGYSLGELAQTVTRMTWADGDLERASDPVSTVPEPVEGNSTAEIAIHPSGSTLYASNRGHNSIAVFAIDPVSGDVSLRENVSTQGETPRNFALSPDARWMLVANQNTDNVVVFEVGADGSLSPTGRQITVDAPVCIDFLKI